MVQIPGSTFRGLNPLVGISVFMMLISSATYAELPTQLAPTASIFSFAVILLVFAMVRQSRRVKSFANPDTAVLKSTGFQRLSFVKPNLATQLIHLSDLHIMGALTDDEYSKAKSLVLDAQRRCKPPRLT